MQKPENQEAHLYNISKALRRLDSFATFQEANFDDLLGTPICHGDTDVAKYESFSQIAIPKWTIPDCAKAGAGCVLWVVDLGGADCEGMKAAHKSGEFTDKMIFRALWSYMLHALFDERCATHGVVIVEGQFPQQPYLLNSGYF